MNSPTNCTLLDGKSLAKRVRKQVADDVDVFVSEYGRAPSLHVVLVGDDPASQVYVRSKGRAAKKAGIKGVTHRLPASTQERTLLALLDELREDDGVDGVLVQFPLPEHLSQQRVIDHIDPDRDVDGLHPVNLGRLLSGRDGLVPCTPLGCMRLIEESGVSLDGANALVVGRSELVGRPLAQLLLREHATVTMAHSHTRDLRQRCEQADVLVVAVGRPYMIPGSWVRPGAVVIDVGINRTDDGSLVGDVEQEAALERAVAMTPVPGGVGPMTIAYLLSNTVKAARLRLGSR